MEVVIVCLFRWLLSAIWFWLLLRRYSVSTSFSLENGLLVVISTTLLIGYAMGKKKMRISRTKGDNFDLTLGPYRGHMAQGII